MSKSFQEASRELQVAVRELGRALATEMRLPQLVRWLSGRLTR